MIRFAVTVSLVEQARGGPFVYWDRWQDACAAAASLGFDAIEIFAPDADTVDRDELRSVLQTTGLAVAAVGTGAGMVVHQLHLCDPDQSRRDRAEEFIRSMIDFGAEFGAPAIIGSMQGRFTPAEGKPIALERLRDSLARLGAHAASAGTPLLYEPLNRYETNLFQQLVPAREFLREPGLENIRLLADLFHMNIEEPDLAAALIAAADRLGHVHFVDSNRQAAGRGHLDFAPIAAALQTSGYDGYISAEAFPIPTPQAAAQTTIETYRKLFPRP